MAFTKIYLSLQSKNRKTYGPGSRIQDVEEFWYKTDNIIIVFDCVWVFDPMVYPGPKFLISITKKLPPFFSEVRGCFFYPMLSHKALATNSLNWKIL